MAAAWPGLTPAVYKAMAWDIVRSSLPEAIKYNLQIVTTNTPTGEVLTAVDTLWTEIQEAGLKTLTTNVKSNLTVGAVTAAPPQHNGPCCQGNCFLQGEELRKRIIALENRLKAVPPPTRFFPQNDRGFLPSGAQGFQRNQGGSNYCYYHTRFGAQAKNCKPPCAWVKRNAGGFAGQKPLTSPSAGSKNA